MKRMLFALLAALSITTAFAADTPPVPTAAPPAPHVALWKVTGKHSTVYLFGSIHVLSPTLQWHDERIDAAIAASGTFFFETALDTDAARKYVAEKGALPEGQSLRALLPSASQKDLDDDMTALGLPEAIVDKQRPWLATIVMLTIQYTKAGMSPAAGVDIAVMTGAQARGQALRYFETMDQQMKLLASDDPKVELQSFEMFLKDFKTEASEADPMVAAWIAGDTDGLSALFDKGFKGHPDARAAMLDNRNKAWVKILKGVLDDETGTFFVTAGAGHMVGDGGVPALLKRAGYKVERI